MKIKKYCVATVQEGMLQIKREMGPDAIIIETRKVREKGIRGLFAPLKVEITAAVDALPGEPQATAALQPELQGQQLQKELSELKQMVNQLVSNQQQQTIGESEQLSHWRQQLINNGVEPLLVQQLLADVHKEYVAKDALSDELLELVLFNKIKDYLNTAEPPDDARILTFVGPTGVGKTTTLAKLAARFALYRNLKVGMITIDTYRIGAVEQLRTYADITGMPIEVVMTPKDMAKALERLADREIILVDTAGRNAKNNMQVSELASFLSVLPSPETFLVLSATTKTKDLRQIVNNFSKVKIKRLILTKLDETETYGALFNVAHNLDMPLTYIATGQNVPDDIENAAAEKLAKLVLGVEEHV